MEEIRSMLTAFGCGIGDELDLKQASLPQDCPHDGCWRRRWQHQNLPLLTFLFRFYSRYCRWLHLHCSTSPCTDCGRSVRLCHNDEEAWSHNKRVDVGWRYPDTKVLVKWTPINYGETTMDPEVRKWFGSRSMMLSKPWWNIQNVNGRRGLTTSEFIETNAKYVTNLDI